MQIREDCHFDNLAIYYWTKLVTEQLSEGMMFKELKKTISINILDFNFIPDNQGFYNYYKTSMWQPARTTSFTTFSSSIYIELKKSPNRFNKSAAQWIDG